MLYKMYVYTLKKSVKIGHYILYNLKDYFSIYFLQVFYQYFEFYTSLHCVLELTEMSVKLMDNVMCNELPVQIYFLQCRLNT